MKSLKVLQASLFLTSLLCSHLVFAKAAGNTVCAATAALKRHSASMAPSSARKETPTIRNEKGIGADHTQLSKVGNTPSGG